ncbi:hypothetical protein KEF29_01215 [Streptomyces tuirus]|uniref:Lipoprotein n=1 Tax=Streptomyces tuirus TaxID=68278 RepID=A0A941FDH4_9ACTN|nr:hypothetical protein [Streptomyces tuirus]
MRAIGVASAVLLGAGALTACVPAAGATDRTDFGFSVVPSTVAPGGQVTLRVNRNACRGEAAVSSRVFDVVTIASWQSWATAEVDWDAEPGAVYDVEFACEESRGTVRLTIAGGRPTGHPGHPDHPTHHGGHPSKGVHAGAGGTLAGFDLKEIGLGAALIAGSLGAAYHVARRRTDEDAP